LDLSLFKNNHIADKKQLLILRQKVYLKYFTHAAKTSYFTNPLLPGSYIALFGSTLPPHPILLAIHHRSHPRMGRAKRDLAGGQANWAMPPLGHQRI